MSTPIAVNFLKLDKVFVQDAFGGNIHLPSFWKEKPAILVFLRHFGCPACRGHAVDVWKNKDQYQKAGARIVFVGNGNTAVIDQFKIDLNIQDAPVYVDNTFESFKACGFKKVDNPYTDEGMKNLKKYMDRGFQVADYAGAGEGLQLGGVIAIKPGNQVTFHYISKIAGDYPELIEGY